MKHDEIIELLPWYANQSLGENERREVAAHLTHCPECAREVKSLSAMQKAILDAEDQGPKLPAMALNRALAQIEDYEHSKAPTRAKRTLENGNWWTQWWKPMPLFTRALIAAQVVAVLALGTVAVYQRTHPTVIYTTASGGSIEDKDAARIVVSFSASATEQEIRQIVVAIKGRIVDGPSAQNLYTVRLPIAREQTAEIERVLEILRQNQPVVRFAAELQ